MRTGLYFGSFNPIHTGHLIIAQHMLNTGLFDEIRFIVSPQNPFKNLSDLYPEKLRLKLVKNAIKADDGFSASDIEFKLPKPSYTIKTLEYFLITEPEISFSIIIGSDNLTKLHEWKDIETICKLCEFHVYSRPGSENIKPEIDGIFHFHTAPLLDISATHIRNLISEGKSIRYLVPDNVFKHFKS